jgi:hypothetical protein
MRLMRERRIGEKLDQGEGIREKLRFSLIKLLSDRSASLLRGSESAKLI